MWPNDTGVSSIICYLMGHADELHLGMHSIIMLEITGTQALRELIHASQSYRILLVAPMIASVTFSTSPVDLEDWKIMLPSSTRATTSTIYKSEGWGMPGGRDGHWHMLCDPI